MSVHARHGWQWLAACAMAVAFMLMTPPAVLAQATDASPEGEPSSAAAQAPSQSKPSFEVRLRDARHRPRLQADPPELD